MRYLDIGLDTLTREKADPPQTGSCIATKVPPPRGQHAVMMMDGRSPVQTQGLVSPCHHPYVIDGQPAGRPMCSSTQPVPPTPRGCAPMKDALDLSGLIDEDGVPTNTSKE